jgi:hypothetical protein
VAAADLGDAPWPARPASRRRRAAPRRRAAWAGEREQQVLGGDVLVLELAHLLLALAQDATSSLDGPAASPPAVSVGSASSAR